MRLTIPEPNIKLYDQGFDEHDKLGRKETGDKLSNLVEQIDDPLVIALDGAWGSGKSHFLKCWVGEHIKEEFGRTSQTVYFDAFKHDYLDDPLIALTGAIAERFHDAEKEAQEKGATRGVERRAKFKKTAWAVSKAAGCIGLSAVTFGATEILSDMGDEIAKSASEEVKTFLSSDSGDEEAEKFWNAHSARIAAMDAFRTALTELTEPAENGQLTRKLIIVIDELDRCRPDYALSLLEIIKHFFDVDGVHFVLGVNLSELANCVRARYGGQANAQRYLQKFYQIRLNLPTHYDDRYNRGTLLKYFADVCSKVHLETNTQEVLSSYIGIACIDDKLTLRDLEHLATQAVLLPHYQSRSLLEFYLSLGIILFSVAKPELIEEIRSGTIPYNQIQNLLPLEKVAGSRNTDIAGIRKSWIWATTSDINANELADLGLVKDTNIPAATVLLSRLVKESLETFKLA